MKKYTIAYITEFGNSGIGYRQRLTIRLTKNELERLNKFILDKEKNVRTFYPKPLVNGKNYITITTVNIISKYIGRVDCDNNAHKRFKTDCNTIVVIKLIENNKNL